MSLAGVMFLALLLDAVLGWSDWLYQRIGHPVTWLGRVISGGERALNAGSDRARWVKGAFLVVIVTVAVACLAWGVARILPGGVLGGVIAAVLAWPLVAARSLFDHVQAVARPLAAGDMEGARKAVSHIVGRNPETLDEAAIARAGLESLAENASDGVVAPLFWGALFGLPGIAAYKTINTFDSMIGYRNARYHAFGWAAARIDDLVNWIPARLTGLLFVIAARGVRGPAMRTMLRDARNHRSPNAGWPEAAVAGALAIRLSGPRVYDGVPTEDAWLNPVAGDPRPEDMARGLTLFKGAIGVFGLLLLLAWVV